MRSLLGLAIGVGISTAIWACGNDEGGGRTEAEIVEEFNELVARSNSCTSAGECVEIHLACPLPCAVSIRADARSAVEARAGQLEAEAEQRGYQCSQGCSSLGSVCVEGHCALDDSR
jgi:hypothetical protein